MSNSRNFRGGAPAACERPVCATSPMRLTLPDRSPQSVLWVANGQAGFRGCWSGSPANLLPTPGSGERFLAR